jgi:hypothetical protein
MVKMLLSAVLVATQVLSWNASPLFLCMSADGSICVDFGPDGCACCQHDAVEAPCTSHHDACHEHDHGQLDDSAADESDPCGCDHIQISEPQAATLARAVAAPDSPHQVIPPAALLSLRTSGCCLSAIGGLAHVPLSGHDVPSAALVLLASVVIQC